MPTDLPPVDPFDFERAFRLLADNGHDEWASGLREQGAAALQQNQHGNLPAWMRLVRSVNVSPQPAWHIDDGHVVTTGGNVDEGLLRQFCPWRKGPLRLGTTTITTEWRSDWKWDRIANHVEWRDRRVLDVGCGNGYFGWRMLGAGAHSVIGLDPFLLYVAQYELIRRLAGPANNFVLPLSDACLVDRLNAFDIVVSMGVLYHRTSPIDHLRMLKEALRAGGRLVLETLIIESEKPDVLVPENRYAKMRNVWFIPSLPMLIRWLRRTGFGEIRVIDVTRTTTEEQQRTDWMTFESLSDFLDPHDANRTIEGDPGPVRATLTASA